MRRPKTVLVTGATGGIGLLVAKELLRDGHRVIAAGRSETRLSELEQAGAEVIRADFEQQEEVQRLLSLLPRLDAAIFAAGYGLFRYAAETEEAEVRRMFEINVFSVMAMTRHLLLNQPDIHLIYVGSMAGKVATPKTSAYAASKHALLGYVNAVRLETAGRATVTAVNTGPVDTGFLDIADGTGGYRTSIRKFLLQPAAVAGKIIRVLDHPVREVNVPRYLAVTSKFHSLLPGFTEKAGRRFFNKK